MNLINLTMQEIYKILLCLERHKSTVHLFVALLHKQLKEVSAIQLSILISITNKMDLACNSKCWQQEDKCC